MSRLDELIKKLCPNGVEYKPIKEVYQRLKGTPITAAKMKEIENSKGDIRIFAGGKTVIDAFEEDIPKANITRVPSVLVQSRGVIDVVYYERPFTFKNEMWAYTHKEKISVRYLHHVLKNNVLQFRKAASGMGSLPQISLKITEEFLIPIPPLEVQREIVRILDHYSELTEELTTKLTTELTARKKQYEFYRRKLLTFEDSIPKIQLRDIASFRNGKGHEKNISNNGKYVVINSKFISTNGQVVKKSYEQLSPMYIDDIAMVMSDLPNGRALAKCYLIDENDKFTLNQRIGGFHTLDEKQVITKYLFYILDRNWQLLKYDNGVDQTNLKKDDILNISIPVPDVSVQKRLVYVLDNFDAICSNLNIGLPAEIEARQKQYEYYRDKLLNFKKLEQ